MSTTTKQLIQIKPSQVVVREDFNTRENYGDIRQLKASIQEKGFDPAFPIIVAVSASPDEYILGSQGHRRLAAALALEKEEKLPGGFIYAILEEDNLSMVDRNLDIIRLNTGEPLSLLAQAIVMKRAKDADAKLTNRELGRRLGFSGEYVNQAMLLLTASEQTLEWVKQEKIAASQVILLLKEHKDATKVEEIVEAAIKDTTETGTGGTEKKAGKVTKKNVDKAKSEKEETEEEKTIREEKEKEEAEAKASVASRNKEVLAITKRADRFVAGAVENNARLQRAATEDEKEKLSPFENAVNTSALVLSAYLQGKHLNAEMVIIDANEKEEAVKIGEVWKAFEAVQKNHKLEVKALKSELEEAHELEVKAFKEEVKTLKGQIKALTK